MPYRTRPVIKLIYSASPLEKLPIEIMLSTFDSLCMRDLQLSVKPTCCKLAMLVHKYLDKEFDILLSRHGLPPQPFRELMASTGAVIGGQAALDYLLRNHIDNPTITLFVPRFKELFFHPLFESARYKWDENLPKPGTWAMEKAGIHDIMTFAATVKNTKRYIKVVRTGDHVLAPFAKGYTTAHMTFLTADAIQTLFPELTFANRALVPRQIGSQRPLKRSTPTSCIPTYILAKMDALSTAGFDVRQVSGWNNKACGPSCPIIQHSVKQSGFRMQLTAAFHQTCRQLGSDIRFVLDDECRNRKCPNFLDRV